MQHKKNYGIRAGPDLFRLVSVLGGGNSLIGGESVVWKFIVERLSNKHLGFGGSSRLIHQEENLLILNFVWPSLSQDDYWAGFW